MQIKSPIRDRAMMARADDLAFSIKLIDVGLGIGTLGPIITLAPTRLGELMAAAGYATSGPELRGPQGWRGSWKEVEQRLKTLAQRRTAAQAALDAAALDDDARANQEAESRVLTEVFNRLHVKGSRDGMGYVVVAEDGGERDLTTLTDVERRAFERMDARERSYRQGVIDRQAAS